MSVLCSDVMVAVQYTWDKISALSHEKNGDKYELEYFPSRCLVKNLLLEEEFETFGNKNKWFIKLEPKVV